ncbi:nuclease-related domain-containing protein [Mycoplasma hafezii]|uniref:nuclease-related domain-containing protein n=1 Tax=Mycoplasma hafezii TaxID=525886 RepID=UPI003CF1DD6D
MNHYIVTFLMIAIFLLLILSWVILFFLHRNKLRGKENQKQGFKFEDDVAKKIKQHIKGKKVKFLPGNIYKYDGKLFEVDGILVFENLVAVIECKSYFGELQGDASATELQLVSYTKKGTITKDFKNPVLQNEKHLNHLEKIIGRSMPLASMIVCPTGLIINVKHLPKHVIITTEDQMLNRIDELLEFSNKNQQNKIDDKVIVTALANFEVKSKREKKEFQKMIEG